MSCHRSQHPANHPSGDGRRSAWDSRKPPLCEGQRVAELRPRHPALRHAAASALGKRRGCGRGVPASFLIRDACPHATACGWFARRAHLRSRRIAGWPLATPQLRRRVRVRLRHWPQAGAHQFATLRPLEAAAACRPLSDTGSGPNTAHTADKWPLRRSLPSDRRQDRFGPFLGGQRLGLTPRKSPSVHRPRPSQTHLHTSLG